MHAFGGFWMPRVHDVHYKRKGGGLLGGSCSAKLLRGALAHNINIDSVVEALTARLQSTLSGSGSLCCPRAAPTEGVVSCTNEQWFKPYSSHRRCCYCFWEMHAAIFAV